MYVEVNEPDVDNKDETALPTRVFWLSPLPEASILTGAVLVTANLSEGILLGVSAAADETGAFGEMTASREVDSSNSRG